MKNKYIMIFDVEGKRNKKPYNIGYIIGDRKGHIVKQCNFALPNNIWENIESRLNDYCFTMPKIEEIFSDFGNSDYKYKYIGNDDFFKVFENDIVEYGILEIWGYNVNYDFNAVSVLYGDRTMPNVNWCDIMSASYFAIMNKKKYVKFCMENNFYTQNNNIQTTLQALYCYITKNPDFKQEHTALSDCKIEYEIMTKIYKKHVKMIKKLENPKFYIELNKIRREMK